MKKFYKDNNCPYFVSKVIILKLIYFITLKKFKYIKYNKIQQNTFDK